MPEIVADTLRIYRKAFDFKGRETRRGLFSFIIVLVAAFMLLAALDDAIYRAAQLAGSSDRIDHAGLELWRDRLLRVFMLANIIPLLAAIVRRLHDANRTAWALLVVLMPYVGWVVLLVVLLLNGEPAPNNYGENPRDPNAPGAIDPDLFE